MTKERALEFLKGHGFELEFSLGTSSSWVSGEVYVSVSDTWVDARNGKAHVENIMQNLEQFEMDKDYLALYFRGGTICVLRRTK